MACSRRNARAACLFLAAEAARDGIYVIRTSVAEKKMSAEAAVLNYKKLAEVERGFRALKGIDLQVRPIRHRLETRVKAHIFLGMLALYGQWHMVEAWNRAQHGAAEGGQTRRTLATTPNAKPARALERLAMIAVQPGPDTPLRPQPVAATGKSSSLPGELRVRSFLDANNVELASTVERNACA